MSLATSNTPRFPYDVHRGPHPGVVAIIYTLLFAVALASFSILSHGAEFPRPFGRPLASVQYIFLHFPDAVRVNALLQFGAAIPLGIFTAAVTSRLSFLGVNVTGVSIALFGGIAASVFFAVSGICGWVLSQPGIANDLNVMHAMQLLGFGCGGFAFTASLGLLMAGISVPCLFGNYTPKWVAWLGLILAAIAELSTLGLIIPQAAYLLPLVRFPSFIWMIWTGFTLTKNRPASAAS